MTPQITVLMGVYNGAPFLEEQLHSIANQTLPPTRILLSDDGSTDGSPDIIHRFAETYPGEVTQLNGPKQGLAANYLHLLRQCPGSDMVAFCDQDDVWLPEKLAHQWTHLKDLSGPAFHGATTWRTDAALTSKRASTFRSVTPALPHAFVQNLAGANTMALNRAGLTLAQSAAQRVEQIAFHDWWLYQLFTATGAQILYEDHPQVLYRQHGGNVIGNSQSLTAGLTRLKAVGQRQYAHWTDLNLKALETVGDLCTQEATTQIARFKQLRAAPLAKRIRLCRDLGLRRHGALGQMALWAAVVGGKL